MRLKSYDSHIGKVLDLICSKSLKNKVKIPYFVLYVTVMVG